MGSRSLSSAIQEYDAAATLLNQFGHSVYVPHHFTNPVNASELSAKEVFERDRFQLLNAEVVLAFINEPSLGVGAEVAIAIQSGKTVLAVRKAGIKTSRFLLGLVELSDVGTTLEYSTIEDLIEEVCRLLPVTTH